MQAVRFVAAPTRPPGGGELLDRPAPDAPGPAVSASDALRADWAGAADHVGGKASNLLRLVELGLPVPPWFVVTAHVFDDVLARVSPPLDALLAALDPRQRAEAEAAAAEARRRILAAGLSEADRDALFARFDATFAPGARVAVRSSALGEDSAEDSYAGQLETYLHVPREALVERVLECLASAYGARALLYRRVRGLEAAPVRVAVVVQAMVESRAAGVLFTADPRGWGGRGEGGHESGRALVAAGLGLGEGVVDDAVPSDQVELDRSSGEVLLREVRRKDQRVVWDRARGQGTTLEAVPPAEAEAPALDDAQLTELAAIGRDLEARLGAPQDVEWAVDPDGALLILQTRPITTLPGAGPAEVGGRERIFDNANVVEGYPGVTTPLTFSFARQGYEAIFREAARAFGVPARTIAAEDDLFRHMIGLVDGRIYYDLLNWYRLYGLVPGFEERVRAWEKALGLERRAEGVVASATLGDRLGAAPARGRVLYRMARNFVCLGRDVRRFERHFARVQAEFRAHDLERLDPDALVGVHERLCSELLGRWGLTVVNDFYAFQLFDALGKLLAREGLDQRLVNDLLCGETGMESVAPVRSLLRLARQVRETPPLAALFAGEPDDARVWARLMTPDASDPAAMGGEADGFRAAVREHLARYGDRTLQELKLETPGLEDHPQLFVALLRNQLGVERSIEAMEQKEQEIRRKAELELRRALRGSPLRASLVRFVLRHARATVTHRENMRLLRTRAFGMVKRVFRQLGRRLAAAGLLAAPDDVFYLTVDEVTGAVRGAGVTSDLRALVALRRAEFDGHRRREPPERVRVRGIVAARRPAPSGPGAPLEVDALGVGELLAGQGCARGRVTATAKVVLDPAQDATVAGEVLVARMTDPGWVFLMVAASGIVVERGSLLSHTAIIGRELGIPTVVGVADATRKIRSGATVELDGDRGTVRVLEAAPGSGADALDQGGSDS